MLNLCAVGWACVHPKMLNFDHPCTTATQVPAFALNQYICIEQFKILDFGGSNVIHMFGELARRACKRPAAWHIGLLVSWKRIRWASGNTALLAHQVRCYHSMLNGRYERLQCGTFFISGLECSMSLLQLPWTQKRTSKTAGGEGGLPRGMMKQVQRD